MNDLTIAIDYDNTFTADPAMFANFVEQAKSFGYAVYCVTARRNTEENVDEINAAFSHWCCQMPIIFTELASKTEAMKKRGIEVDIWIDDDPHTLVHGH
jgi:hypothetical protein